MNIQDLLDHDDPFLKDIAEKAARYKVEHAAGELSDEAYAKLSVELTDLQAQNAACEREETREKLAEALEIVAQYLLGKV